MKSKKTLFTFLLFILVAFTSLNQIKANSILINASSAISADVKTGAIYDYKNIDQQVGLASISKFFVVSYFLQNMEAKNLTLDSEITISENVANTKNKFPEASGIYLPAGENISIRKLIELSLVISDNGATIQLAEALDQSEETFVNNINAYFQSLGLVNTKFINVSGLDVPDGKNYLGNYSTPRETMQLTIDALTKTPNIVDFTSMQSIEYKNKQYNSLDQLLPGGAFGYDGVKGLKTGNSSFAGYCYLGYYEKDDKQIITLVTNTGSNNKRFSETTKLLNNAIKMSLKTIINKDHAFKINLNNANLLETNIYLKYDFAINSENNENFVFEKIEFNPEFIDNNKLLQTVEPGQTIAYLYLKADDNFTSQTIYANQEYIILPLSVDKKLKKNNFFQKILYCIPQYFINLYNTI